jgi:DNA-binding transcriptional LysR family regulator
MLLEIRHLRYVVAVADHGNFTRAAEHLHVAQPALSQQILKVERELGFDLFLRHPRGAVLTTSGEAFVADARETLRSFEETVDRAARRSRGQTGTLAVGFTARKGFELLPQILAAFAARFPSVDVELREYNYVDSTAGLADESVEVAFVRPPLSARGLWYETLTREPRIVALANSHRLAQREAVAVAELLDERMIGSTTSDELSSAFWSLDDYRDGQSATFVGRADSIETELQLVAAGQGIAITCAGSARFHPRPGVTFVPVADISPSEVALARRAGDANPLVENFIAVAREARDALAIVNKRDLTPGLSSASRGAA